MSSRKTILFSHSSPWIRLIKSVDECLFDPTELFKICSNFFLLPMNVASWCKKQYSHRLRCFHSASINSWWKEMCETVNMTRVKPRRQVGRAILVRILIMKMNVIYLNRENSVRICIWKIKLIIYRITGH